MKSIYDEIIRALKRACPAYEPPPRGDDIGEYGRWTERMEIADHIDGLIIEYQTKQIAALKLHEPAPKEKSCV